MDIESVSSLDVPAKKWLETKHSKEDSETEHSEKETKPSKKKAKVDPTSTPLVFNNGISLSDRAGINNWYHTHIPGAPQSKDWFERLPIAHARTCSLLHVNRAVFIKNSKYLTLTNDQERVRHLLRRAWKLQMEPTPFLESVDVDREALKALEEKMFECSSKAGPAGNMQWGLDAGPLQNSWSPYLLDWSDGTYQPESETEGDVSY